MKTPPEIKILPDEVANRIAAGEVVERPASALKEMLENSIDAGASRIEIDFARGGKTFVRIADNGCGMTRHQALTSLEQHATSKIANPEDIFNISSYGFRGEAVPSIASVSRFKMRTRPHNQELGTEIIVDAGTVRDVRECGMPEGTEITVEDIFCSVPARKKFLKSDNVEASHITRICKLYATALPDLRISLREDSKTIFESESGLETMERIRRIYGAELADKLVSLGKHKLGSMELEGAILKPAESFATSRNISFFLNDRPVECRAVFSALKEAYSQFVPKGRFAAAFLFLKIDPRQVDVNVHPAKREVRLKDEFSVRDFIQNAIEKRLAELAKTEFSKADNIPEPEDFSEIKTPPTPAFFPPKNEPAFSKNFPETHFVSGRIKETISTIQLEEKQENNFKIAEKTPAFTPRQAPLPTPIIERELTPKNLENSPEKNHAPQARSLESAWRFVGFFQKRFAIFETEKSLALLSISAALKRIDYEKILAGEKLANSQKFLIAVNLKFERADAEFFEANRSSFENCGFEIENFGGNFYRITAAPAWLDFSEVENFARDFVELAREENQSLKPRALATEHFARIAVRRIGAASFDCTESNAIALLAELLKCPSHVSSPDGKPTIREISAADFARMFSLG